MNIGISLSPKNHLFIEMKKKSQETKTGNNRDMNRPCRVFLNRSIYITTPVSMT